MFSMWPLSKRFIQPRKGGAIALLCLLSCLLGLGLSLLHPPFESPAQAQLTPASSSSETTEIGTIDPIPSPYQLGADLYVETCTTCHVGVPPQVLPVQSWQRILDDTRHYGVQLPPLVDPNRLLIWQYISVSSRSIQEREEIPYRISASRYFRALHPRVVFNSSVSLQQCISCHPGASAYNFRQLTAEWDNAP